MRAIELAGAFGLDHLAIVERPDPSPGPHQVVVAVRAISLNYRDLLMVTGRYNPRQPLPLVPFSDGAGEVVAVGAGVTTVKPGDRVVGLFCQDFVDGAPDKAALRSTLGGPLDGMGRTLAVLDERGVAPFPAHLSFAEASCLPCAALTAWTAVVEEGRTKPGDVVLTLGTGGVSLAALAFAKRAGARVVVTTSSDAKAARLAALGADVVVDRTKNADWDKAAREASGGRGADLVVEVGGAGTLARSIRAVRPGGTIALIGVLASGETPNLTSVLMNHIRVQGVFVGHRRAFLDMCRAIDDSRHVPVVDRAFPFADAAAALAALERAEHVGKIVLTVD